MVGRHKLLISIFAIALIPVLLGMTPLNLVHKLSNRCPLSQEKQIQRAGSCLFHSLVSQDDLNIVSLNSTPLDPELTSVQELRISILYLIPFNIPSNSVPLRC
jgi:hypothetical protein